MAMLRMTGTDHKRAPLKLREIITVSKTGVRPFLGDIMRSTGIAGCVLLSTCNRFEIYYESRDAAASDAVRAFLASRYGLSRKAVEGAFYELESEGAARHLFSVASGTESQIMGESQILGQVRSAYSAAVDSGSASKLMNRLFHAAVRVGKKARSETAIGRDNASVSSAAVALARSVFRDLRDKTVLLVGAGETAALVAECIARRGGSRVIVVSRTSERAERLASRFSADHADIKDLPEKLKLADIVISATESPHFIIGPAAVRSAMRSRGGGKMLLIDIAVPRDVDPKVASIPGVSLYNIDDLDGAVERARRARAAAARAVSAMVEAETGDFSAWLSKASVLSFADGFRGGVKKMVESEASRLEKKIRGGSDVGKAIRAFSEALINRITAAPIEKIGRCAAARGGTTCVRQAECLFSLSGGGCRCDPADTGKSGRKR